MNSPSFIFINGKGGSGKDTQADLLLQRIGDSAIRISTGDVYRDAKCNSGEYARFHDVLMPYIQNVDNGGFIPDEVIVDVVKEIIAEKIAIGKETFIFTGFPRTVGQLEVIDRSLLNQNGVRSLFIHYDIADSTSRERAANRRRHALEGGKPCRPDDDPDVVENRLQKYHQLTYPMLLGLDKKGRLISIDAEGTIPEIEKETSTRVYKERL